MTEKSIPDYDEPIPRKRQRVAAQPPLVEGLTEPQSKCIPRVGLMMPSGPALHHPAAPMLQAFGTFGTPVENTCTWTLEELDEAIEYNAHPSARTKEAAAELYKETQDKVAQGFAKVIPWRLLRQEYKNKRHLKVSPIAAIPHKSRSYRMILDLSARGRKRRRDGTVRPSVNETTIKEAAPLKSMAQLGSVLPRCIHMLATAPEEDGIIVMAKYDIKDGFWRLVCDINKAETFCYSLPKLSEDEETTSFVLLLRPAEMLLKPFAPASWNGTVWRMPPLTQPPQGY